MVLGVAASDVMRAKCPIRGAVSSSTVIMGRVSFEASASSTGKLWTSPKRSATRTVELSAVKVTHERRLGKFLWIKKSQQVSDKILQKRFAKASLSKK